MRYHFEDWTPLFREPCPSREAFAVEIPVSVVEEYRQAKEALIRASAKLDQYDKPPAMDATMTNVVTTFPTF